MALLPSEGPETFAIVRWAVAVALIDRKSRCCAIEGNVVGGEMVSWCIGWIADVDERDWARSWREVRVDITKISAGNSRWVALASDFTSSTHFPATLLPQINDI